ncbi:hypothetical protein [Jiangella muralis]|uniref:hypothetical protein n=1 Tax=Jiangella muralis TaxID=702383 RepID=UPI0012FB09A1|nr:hypothetical protein [Jiangella muralis]
MVVVAEPVSSIRRTARFSVPAAPNGASLTATSPFVAQPSGGSSSASPSNVRTSISAVGSTSSAAGALAATARETVAAAVRAIKQRGHDRLRIGLDMNTSKQWTVF